MTCIKANRILYFCKMLHCQEKSKNQFVFKDEKRKVELYIKREDLLHPLVSGNKFRKLKYNLKRAQKEGHTQLVTFGGAFSNHILATAAAANELGFKSIGIIRGEELGNGNLPKTLESNSTLRQAVNLGMQLYFISRQDYRNKNENDYLEKLEQKFGSFYLIPEGGTNELAVQGCEEILTPTDIHFDYVAVAVGTGGTISGVINSSFESQQVLGFPALRGDFLRAEIQRFVKKDNWQLILNYHFGGYAKVNEELISFINTFKQDYQLALDPVYTGKMMYGLLDLIKNNYFSKNTRILALHTGGLQGIYGMNVKLKQKGLSQLQ